MLRSGKWLGLVAMFAILSGINCGSSTTDIFGEAGGSGGEVWGSGGFAQGGNGLGMRVAAGRWRARAKRFGDPPFST